MDQQQQPRWRLTELLWTVPPALVLIVVIASYLFEWKWTGFADRTLWDWLKLLLAAAIPAVLGFLGNQVQQKIYLSQQHAEEKRAQDAALQAYLDQIGQLMLDKDRPLRHPEEGDEVQTLARARTLTVLPRLGGDRKARVVQFLYESDLIAKIHPIVPLVGADLSGAYLHRADLRGVA